MMEDALVIGDIAGNFLTLKALLEKAGDKAKNIISVGDIIDRGPRSKEVVEFFRARQRIEGLTTIVIKGNHEDMLVSDCKKRWNATGPGDWKYNGGIATADSFGRGGEIPADVVEWLDALPLYVKLTLGGKRYLISHAYADNADKLPGTDATLQQQGRFLWNRGTPQESSNFDLQICGHNSHFGLKTFGNPPIGQCIDTSADKILTGYHIPTGTVFQQEYID